MSNNPVFDDEVYYGYIPSDPAPDFSIHKDIHDMTTQEKQDTLERFAKNQTDALNGDEDRRLSGRYWRDDHHKRMIVAQERGDEYLAEAIMKRDSEDTLTVQGKSMPTQLSQNKVLVLAKLLGVLFSMPKEVKQALLCGNFSALLRDPTNDQPLKGKVPPTPLRDSNARDKSSWKPYIYILHLVTNRYRNPTMKTMRTILEYANDYVRHVREGLPGDKPMRRIKDQNYTASIQEMDKVLRIERAKRNESGGLLQGALTSEAFKRALADGTKELPCLYITSNSQLAGIKETIKLTTAWLDKLEQDGWSPVSADPLPYTIPASGWTANAPKRQHDYYSHKGINGKILLFDAISRAMNFNGLSWRCLLLVWDKRIVSMAEHIAHVLGGTYVAQGGLNSQAAGISVATSTQISSAVYKDLQRRLNNTAHWPQNMDATRERTMQIRASLDALPRYLQLKQDRALMVSEQEALIKKLEDAKQKQANKKQEEVAALNRRVKITGQLINDLSCQDKCIRKLKCIRDALYASPDLQEIIRAGRSHRSQVSLFQLSQLSQPRADNIAHLRSIQLPFFEEG